MDEADERIKAANERIKAANERIKEAERSKLAQSVEFVVILVRDFSVSLDDAVSRLHLPDDAVDAVRAGAEAVLSSEE